MKSYQNYRAESHRHPTWDYSGDGLYFITFLTQHRICNLGSIQMQACKAEMILSDYGKIIENEWLRSFEIRRELICDEYIIMPNHLHAIIRIDHSDSQEQTHGRASLAAARPSDSRSKSPSDSPSDSDSPKSRISEKCIRLPQSISSFLGGYKSAINSRIDDYIDLHQLKIPKYNRNNHFFQPNYHDFIIRDAKAYHNIKNYIINNPQKWAEDKFRK
jgi:REP element-mobilizing transposase RayT